MPSPRSLLPEVEKQSPSPARLSADELRPRSSTGIFDASFNLLRRRPALLVPLGALHVLPAAVAASALATLPGRAFPIRHPSFALAALASFAAAAVALRPFALAATVAAVAALVRGEEPRPGECLRAAASRPLDILGVAARALAVDLASLGLARCAGAHHLATPLVVLEGRGAVEARREASHLRATGSHALFLLNLHHLAIYLAMLANLWVGTILAVELARTLLGLDLAAVRGFVSPRNLSFLYLVAAVTGFALEPLRAVSKALLAIDLRLREEGTDLKIRLERLGG